MKRNISDLLDAYFEESVELDRSTPLSSRRIKELTMNKITPKTSRKKYRTPVRLLTAAAIVAALSVSALAAGHVLGAGTLFQDFFGTEETSLTAGQIEMMDQMGKTFENLSVTSNGATMTPIAILADENVCYLRLRIEAPEGVVLPDLDEDADGYYQLFGEDWETERLTLEPEEGAYPSPDAGAVGYRSVWLPDDDPTDNVKEAVVYLTVPNGAAGELKFNDGVSKLLTIRGLWIQSPYKAYTQVFGGEFTFDVGLNCESKVISLDCEGAVWTDPVYGYTVQLERLELSPLSLSFCYWDNLLENPWIGAGYGDLQIVMKDGTEYFEHRFDEEPVPGWDDSYLSDTFVERQENYDVFEAPLDLSQIDYIRYGDYKFPVEIP